MWLNFGILPFWFMLIFFPQSKICKIFVTSIFPFLVLAAIDLYLIFEIFKNGFNFFDVFNLYLSIEELIDDIERDHAITKTEILEALYKIKSEIEDHNLKYEEETDY